MALEVMSYKSTSVGSSPEILYHSKYIGEALTLDATAFTSGVCKAGTPIAKDGTKAVTTGKTDSDTVGSSNAYGILLYDVYSERPQGTVVIDGFIKTAVAQTHSGVTVDAAAKIAMPHIMFM